MDHWKAYVLCRFARRSSLYNCWLDQSPVGCEVVDRYPVQWEPPADAGIVITHLHYRWEEIHILRRIVEQNRVPVLILADGVIEYRNTWAHPSLADGSVFQPVVGHKLACIGRSQARVIESWGNPGLCEVVGLPRFDSYLSTPPPAVQNNGPFRLLIATAQTPFFDQSQKALTVQALMDLRRQLDQMPQVGDRPLQVIWRLTAGLDECLSLVPHDPTQARPLGEVLDEVDAVITTPSTLYLEGVLKRRPVAILDYHNCPQFVPPAWTISAPRHIEPVLRELADPPEAKLLFQQMVLRDALECESYAKPRLMRLIDEMVRLGTDARAQCKRLEFPRRILADPDHGFQRVESSFDTSRLYAANPAYASHDLTRLQAELSQAISRLGDLPAELLQAQKYIDELLAHQEDVRQRLFRRNRRVKQLRQQVAELQARKVPETDH